jgi:hypothetical protein
VNTIIGDIIKHLTPDRVFEEYYPKLHAIMIKLLATIEDFPALFAMVHPLLKREKERCRTTCVTFLFI